MNQADNLSGRGYSIVNRHDRPRIFSRVFPIGLFDLRYAWGENQLSFGTAVDDPAGLTLGFRRTLAKGALTSSLFYSIFGREWQNPYLFGTPRTDTTVHTYGGRVAWEQINGTPLSLSVKGSLKRINNEALTGELRRNGALLDVDLSYRQRLSDEWTLIPYAGYLRGEYDGSANNFNGGIIGLGATWQTGDLKVTTRLAGTLAEHDRVHPVFSQRRHDLGYRFSTLLTWGSPFGWQHWFTSAGIIRSQISSNIDFFVSSATFGYALMGYQF